MNRLAMTLLGAGAALLAFAALIGLLVLRTNQRDVAVAYGDLVAQATRDAAGNPRLARSQVPEQIRVMGDGLRDLRDGLTRCNASARAAAENDARRQRAAQAAARAAQERAAGAEATSARLRASAARGGDPGGSCEPSETVREIWR